MCGINGFNFVDKNLLKQMNDSLNHRGPEEAGTFFYQKKVSLGHRRLAIIDLSSKGSQPMSYTHKGEKVTIVFNGEIYNFQEVRKELKKKGYEFKSDSDTEVVLASYIEWGKNCVNKFNGMWAFCIYDPQKKILFLSRDRVGKKPLYYYFDGNKFIFSSEIKGILKHKTKRELNPESIDLYFSLGFIPSPYSIYKNIQKLEQRQSLIFDLAKKEIQKEYYYDWPNFNPKKNKKNLKKEFDSLMVDSVKLRMISDVPLGAFLSGGLDSSTIVNYVKKFTKDLNTYSIGFEGKYDESPNINITKNHFQTNHHHKYFKEEDFKKELKNIFEYYDEPFSDPSMFPTKFLTKFAKEKLTVCLSGDGGDEIFGGYPRYKIAYQMEILRKIPKLFRKILLKIVLNAKIKEGLRLSLLSKDKFYSEARDNFYKPEITKEMLSDKLKGCLRKTNGNLVEAIRLMDIYLYTLPDNFLAKVDRASMANSLEVRCPFLDYRIIEYSMKLPTKYKVSFFKEKTFFREIISQFLPKKIINQKKKGFTPPINSWIQKEEYSKEISKAINELAKAKILSKKWIAFYNKEIFTTDSLVSNNYKIRLFLFWYWWKYWTK
ncbi:asparagine synthase (glutamine-hydrolyzing) [archaeon]|jgi:asparagine synthase (glutamine-hydrolysing)|nr:asparagine synthase (glutamine-hydrolyzing) [archaeon]